MVLNLATAEFIQNLTHMNTATGTNKKLKTWRLWTDMLTSFQADSPKTICPSHLTKHIKW